MTLAVALLMLLNLGLFVVDAYALWMLYGESTGFAMGIVVVVGVVWYWTTGEER